MRLATGGEYQWRRDGPPHLFNPETVFRLQHATRARRYDVFREYTRLVDDQSSSLMTLRGLFRFAPSHRHPVPLDEVEPIESIVQRFNTGAMSYGSISKEAHETLAIAMNRLGGAVEHGRGRRGRRPAARPRAAQPDQAGRLRPVRRDEHVPEPRGRHPDQDGAGREARRGRPAAAREDVPVDRPHPALDRGRRPHLAAAAPRHLLDRGPQAADLRPEARQPGGPHPREAREPVRHRRGRGRGDEGEGRRGARLRPRRRHRRQPAQLAEARGHPVGARPRRDPADADAERAPRPRHRAGRRPDEVRPRRDRRRAARRGGVRLRDRAARRLAAAS